MYSFDVCIIGGGILGCMVARELSRYKLKTALLESKPSVCQGITKANSAIIYAGYDHKCKTLKSGMCLKGNANMEALCQELEVPFDRCGSLMLAFGPKGEDVLQRKLDQGTANMVPGLSLLDKDEILALEPHINPAVTRGLYAQTTATVNPWELGIAAFDNAVENGVTPLLNMRAMNVSEPAAPGSFFEIECIDSSNGSLHHITSTYLVNCAGIFADKIRDMLLPPRYELRPTKASFLVFSNNLKTGVNHIIFYEPESDKKGITLVPTTDGSLLAGGSLETADSREDTATSPRGLEALKSELSFLIPNIDLSELIHSFAGLRPNPYDIEDAGKSIPGFIIDWSPDNPRLISLIGIKTPGLTCSQELALQVIAFIFQSMDRAPKLKDNFISTGNSRRLRRGKPRDSKLICHCNHITQDDIKNAARSGIATWEELKHRFFVGMGRCQGSRCRSRIMKIVEKEQETFL